MIKKVSTAIIFILISTVTFSQKVYTLQECIDLALENNRDIHQQKLTYKQLEIAYNQARTDMLPNLNASLGQNFVFGRSIGLDNTYQNTNSAQTSFGMSSSITLFDGLKMKHNINARKADLMASEADLDKIEEDIEISVLAAFFHVLMNKELLLIAVEQFELSKINITRISELVERGKMSQSELYELEAQIAKEDMDRVTAENNLKLSLLDLAQIVELEDFLSFDIVTPSIDMLIKENIIFPVNSIYGDLVLKRPEIRSTTSKMNSAKSELLMAKSQHYPILSLNLQMNTGYYRMSERYNNSFGSQIMNNISNSVGLNLSIPIFNRFQIRNSIKNAEILLESSKLNIDKAKTEFRKRIEQAYYNAQGAQSRWIAAQKSEIASREAYRFTEQKYENGRATAYELIQAKSNLTQVLSEQAQAKYEYAFRLRILKLLVK